MKYGLIPGRLVGARKNKLLVLLASSSLLGVWGSQAFADDAQIAKLQAEIRRIEAHQQAEISALRAEIHHLKHRGGAVYATKGEPAAPGLGPHVIESSKGPVHFGFSDADGQNTVELTGQLNIDTGGYVGVHAASSSSKFANGLASGINFRRARIGVQGVFLGDWAYRLQYDLGGNSDGYSPTVASGSSTWLSGGAASGIENAFISYDGLYKHGGPLPTEFTLGAIDVPWTLDEPVGSPNIMFMERPSSQVIATEFGAGDSRTAGGFHSNTDRLWVGGFVTGPTTGALHNTNSGGTGQPYLGPQIAVLGRVTYNIFQDKANNATLHIGANFADTVAPRTGTNAEGFSLSDRAELRVDPTSTFGTGTIYGHGGQVYGAELAATYQNAFLEGEYYHYVIDTKGTISSSGTSTYGTNNGPAVGFNGGYVQGSYTFGGRRYYVPGTGSYSGVIPDHPFVLGSGGWGALELAGRFDIVDLNARVPGTTGAILGGRQTSYGAGATWYPNNNLRFMLDYEHVIEYQPTVYNGPNVKGGTIDWIAARSQIVF
jgi:phosphate-selective porin OprO and OprP